MRPTTIREALADLAFVILEDVAIVSLTDISAWGADDDAGRDAVTDVRWRVCQAGARPVRRARMKGGMWEWRHC